MSCVWTVMVAPLRPLITPWIWALCAAATPHSNRTADSDRVTMNANFTALPVFMIFLSFVVLCLAGATPAHPRTIADRRPSRCPMKMGRGVDESPPILVASDALVLQNPDHDAAVVSLPLGCSIGSYLPGGAHGARSQDVG